MPRRLTARWKVEASDRWVDPVARLWLLRSPHLRSPHVLPHLWPTDRRPLFLVRPKPQRLRRPSRPRCPRHHHSLRLLPGLGRIRSDKSAGSAMMLGLPSSITWWDTPTRGYRHGSTWRLSNVARRSVRPRWSIFWSVRLQRPSERATACIATVRETATWSPPRFTGRVDIEIRWSRIGPSSITDRTRCSPACRTVVPAIKCAKPMVPRGPTGQGRAR